MQRHLVLIGFKHVGKSIIGRKLAARLRLVFADVDRALERLYYQETRQHLSCRLIMQKHGRAYFQTLEHQALQQVLTIPAPAVISVGGGTPLYEPNRCLLEPHRIILIEAEPDQVFERIMAKGVPPFFKEGQDPKTSFLELWQERRRVYVELAEIYIKNDATIDKAVQTVLKAIGSSL